MRLKILLAYKFIIRTLAIFLVSSTSVFAQIRIAENFAPITEDFCWMKECKIKDGSLPLQTPVPWKAANVSLAEEKRDPPADFNLKSDPATEQDAGLQILNSIPQTPIDQDSVLVKELDESGHFAIQNDSFRNEG